MRSNYRNRLGAPSSINPFGTNRFGRNVFSRILFGARISLQIGVAVALVSFLTGAAIGLAAGWWRGIDRLLMRVMHALTAFPGLLLAIAMSATLGPSEITVIIALFVSYTPHTARVMGGAVPLWQCTIEDVNRNR